jgi:hypothetical protein
MSVAAPDREARARRAVVVAAWASLVAAVAAGVLGLAGSPTTSDKEAALVFLALALSTASFCLGHGRRHDHERGRAVATVTIMVAVVGISVMALRIVRGM